MEKLLASPPKRLCDMSSYFLPTFDGRKTNCMPVQLDGWTHGFRSAFGLGDFCLVKCRRYRQTKCRAESLVPAIQLHIFDVGTCWTGMLLVSLPSNGRRKIRRHKLDVYGGRLRVSPFKVSPAMYNPSIIGLGVLNDHVV